MPKVEEMMENIQKMFEDYKTKTDVSQQEALSSTIDAMKQQLETQFATHTPLSDDKAQELTDKIKELEEAIKNNPTDVKTVDDRVKLIQGEMGANQSNLKTQLDTLKDKVESRDHDRSAALVFDDNTDPVLFFRIFENITKFRNYSEEKKKAYFSTCLRGASLTWLAEYGPQFDTNNFDQIKKDFIEHFSREQEWLSDLIFNTLTMKPGQSVISFYNDVRERAMRLSKSPAEMASVFQRGLIDDIRIYTHSKQCKTLQDILTEARRAESLRLMSNVNALSKSVNALSVLGEPLPGVEKSAPPPKEGEPNMSEVVGAIKMLASEVRKQNASAGRPANQRAANPMMRCDWCSKPNHGWRQCRARLASLQSKRTVNQVSTPPPQNNNGQFQRNSFQGNRNFQGAQSTGYRNPGGNFRNFNGNFQRQGFSGRKPDSGARKIIYANQNPRYYGNNYNQNAATGRTDRQMERRRTYSDSTPAKN